MRLIKYKLFIFLCLLVLVSLSISNSQNIAKKQIEFHNNTTAGIWQQYITVGWTKSFGSGSDDVWLIKTDYDGNMIWNKTYGGKRSDRGFSVNQTIDNGYIITGYTSSYGNGILDLWLIKTDINGIEEWNRTYGGGDSDFGLDVIELNEEGFIITGHTSSFGPKNSNIWLIKTDSFGNLIWDKVFGGKYCESGFSVIEDNGDYIISGYTESFGSGGYDGFVIKTRDDGSIIWNNTFGGKHTDVIRSVEKIENGGYITIGWSESSGSNNEDIWVMNLDNNGNALWNKTYNIGLNDEGFSICKTSDEGYLIVGSTQNFYFDDTDILLMKINKNGEKEWSRIFGGFLSDVAYDIKNTSDGGFIITGYTTSYSSGQEDIWLIKTNENGKILYTSINLYKNIFSNIKMFENIFFSDNINKIKIL